MKLLVSAFVIFSPQYVSLYIYTYLLLCVLIVVDIMLGFTFDLLIIFLEPLGFLVDIYVKIQNNTRLDFMRNNQSQLRAELYQGIMDTMNSGECNAVNVGCRIIIPPSFIGGPTNLKKWYLNVMALVHRYRKTNIFLTKICNPIWIEIKEELAEGENAQDGPYLVSRSFRAKSVVLKKLLKGKKFGKIIHVIEFQKHGPPHAHFLIILQPAWKIKQLEQSYQFVSAEVPSLSNLYLDSLIYCVI